ncbi:MAG: serine/threonine-protein kinase [Pseudomonadota bacterium]
MTAPATPSNVTTQLQEPIQFGKYTLYERIGRGGMADVFKGRIRGPAGFERVFVVKRILPNLSDDPAFIKMFVEEAKMSARLNHPNIVQIFELGSVEGEFFISMEYVPGHDLSETMRALWKSSGAPRPDLVAYVGREICRALAYAHGLTDEHGQHLGMIHRDVSPSNVMLSTEGAVKLLDFGIAKALGDTPEETKSGTLKGKYAYMAPEQTESDDVDHRIDIFAAGIVMHEVLTGRRLFKGQNDFQTIERVRRCEVRPPSQLNPACPPAFDAILLRALSRDREDRFQTAAEMADALDEIVHAAHFTPQHLAAILRDTFGGDGAGADRMRASGTTHPSISTSSSAGRSPTVPPIAISRPRTSGRIPVVHAGDGGASTAAALRGIAARPVWKRASFWLVASLCAAGIGVAVFKNAGVQDAGSQPADRALPAAAAASPLRPKKSKRLAVLVQSEPEGADIYVAAKLESQGRTPKWVTLDVDQSGAPTRIMIRKSGFQDKAIAVESEKPPVVQLIPIAEAPDPTAAAPAPREPPAAELPALSGERGKSGPKAAPHRASPVKKPRR